MLPWHQGRVAHCSRVPVSGMATRPLYMLVLVACTALVGVWYRAALVTEMLPYRHR
jgi:hypothetical protein